MQESYPGEYKVAYDQAVRLCRLLLEKHYSEGHAQVWEPLDNLSGVITQLDNITTKWPGS